MRIPHAIWFLVGGLLLAALLACGNEDPKVAARAQADKRDQARYAAGLADFEKRLEKEPHNCDVLQERATFRSNTGEVENYRAALADLTECIQFGPKEKLAAAYNARATVRVELFDRAKDVSQKAACLADLDEAMKLDPHSSALHLTRARYLAVKFGEPFLAEEDIIEAGHLANYEAKTMDSEQRRFLTMEKVYDALAAATKGTPAETEYRQAAKKALVAWDTIYETERRLAIAAQRERNRQREAQAAAVRAEEARLAKITERDEALRAQQAAALQAEQRRLWANRRVCRSCDGRGYTLRGASSEHHIDWIQRDAHHEVMRVTHTTTPSTRATCTNCWGKGWLDNDD